MEAKTILHLNLLIDTYNHERLIERAFLIPFGKSVYFEKMETTVADVV